MKYTKLGNTDLTISRICMGCMGFGDPNNGMHSWTLDYPESFEIVRQGLELGINFFDTAIGYQNGTSEQYVGKALKELTARQDVVVATKFMPRTSEQRPHISTQDHIEKMLNTSLCNLGMDYIDLYILHMWDYGSNIYDVMEGLNTLVQSGKVRHIGVSNCFAWQIAEANALAEREGFAPFVSVQGHYNLIYREEEREMTPYCDLKNIALTPYSALASGRLSKRSNEISQRMKEDTYAKFKYDGTAEQDQRVIQRVVELTEKYNVSMTEIALSWLLTKVTSPIVGTTKISNIETAVKSTELELSEHDIQYLEELYLPHALSGIMAQNTAKRPLTNKW
ncbi:aldo/keto reductase [uncultured Tolumonas sp.]|uniref:aldo/keto reductase n=1 Tax=uncultured Tolumonas sp. TaxID=263765 RepID=UPI0029306155|nr:aldo/keto reductase [uncultured Tolumonas sp.]